MCHRPSSPDLAQAAITGITVMGGEVKDYGVVTTPMLHYFVASINTDGIYAEATEDGYFKKMTTAFKKLRGDVSFVSNFYCIYYHTPLLSSPLLHCAAVC
jgi:phosphoacetylglucosamine mutase